MTELRVISDMYEVLLAIDDDTSRARSQVATITDVPVETESVLVRVLHVFTDNPTGATIRQLRSAKAVENALDDRGFEYTLEERSGDPSGEILEHADEHDVDLLCLAGRKRSPTGKALFGSVTQDVVLNTDRPVLVCDADGDETERS